MNLSSEALADADVDKRLLTALRARKGRATESDLVVESGVAPHLLGPSLRRTMLIYQCTIETTDDGDVVYVFDPELAPRDDGARRWREIRRKAWAGFRAGFKVAIAVVLVLYFLVVVALVVAATVALLSQRRDSDSGYSSRRSSGLGDLFLWAWIFGDRDYRARRRVWRHDPHYERSSLARYESSRWATDQGRRTAHDRRPFHQKVFAFVFGREEEERDELFTEKQLLAYIRSVGGVVSPSELVTRTGWSIQAAEKQSTRLIAEYGGDVVISENGQVLYVFPELMATAGGPVALDTRPAPAIWQHYEAPQPITGNTEAANLGIAALNLSVLVGALALIPYYAAPVLGIDMAAPAARIGLYLVPAVYSALFFLVPIYRAVFHVGPENRRRAGRNTRRFILQQVYARSLPAATPVSLSLAALDAPPEVELSARTDAELAEAFNDIAFDFGAESEVDDDGRVSFTFDRIAAENTAARQARALGNTMEVTHIGDRVMHRLPG